MIDSMNDRFYAWYINATNPYRLLFGKRKGGFIWVKKSGRFWLVSHEGIRLYSPSAHCLGASVGVFEQRFEPVLKVERGDTVMDVGASIGDTSVIFARKCAPGKVIAVEPEPLNCECLELNLAGFPHKVIQRAAWGRKETLKFHINPSVMGHSIAGLPDDIGSIEVQADTIDSMAEGTHIDFLKIDVQGAELEALKGAKDLLKTGIKVVVETHYLEEEMRSTLPEVVCFLKDQGLNVKTTPQIKGCFAPDIVHAWR